VLLREDRPGDRRLVAYVVATIPKTLSTSGLRDFLAKQLPEYMVPAAFVISDALPLTPNGKVDRRALPAPDGCGLSLDSDYAEPRDPLEEQMAVLWANLLGIEKVGVHNNFFLLGGHSLLASKFIVQARTAFNVELNLREVFEKPTVAGLAGLLKQKQEESARAGATTAQLHALAFQRGMNAATDITAGRLILRSGEEGATYVKVFREGAGQPPVICVGDARFVPLILEQLPKAVPVLLLGLDGCHVWPPQYLNLEQQVAAYVAAINAQTSAKNALVVGYSYGGFLAYRLAAALLEHGWEQIEVNLVEPGFPVRYLPIGLQLREFRRQARLWVRRFARRLLSRPPAPGNLATINGQKIPDGPSRWNMMERHYLKNVRNAHLVPLRQRIGLVGTKSYFARSTHCWNLIASAGIEECLLPSEANHSEVFLGECGLEWLKFLTRSYHRLCVPNESTISTD
jgi:pimeloyl-ACP methyl ester carboxylesterase